MSSREDWPRVSVVMPVRNNERFIAQALQSIVDGDHQPHEIIVVDDDSDDGSGEVARRFPVRYVRQPRQGQAPARNAGVRMASGELVAFLDADDEWTPDKLSRQVGHLVAHPDLDFVLAHMRAVLEPGVDRPPWLPETWLTEGERGSLPGTLVARRWAFERVGLFDPEYQVSNDTDWFVRAADAGLRWEILPDILLRWRVHADNASHRRAVLRADILRLTRASVERKRVPAAGGPNGG